MPRMNALDRIADHISDFSVLRKHNGRRRFNKRRPPYDLRIHIARQNIEYMVNKLCPVSTETSLNVSCRILQR
jgi:hypothetical protein